MTTLLTNLQSQLPDLECITDANQVLRLSQDYNHFSPILQPIFADKRAIAVLRPAHETDVLAIAKFCVVHQIPLTVRGAGTGNYGQCVPLNGGFILDMTRMNALLWQKPGIACVEPGVKLATIDRLTRPNGWEIRMAPSTYRTATIGGFIGGGSGGMGSITYGQLRDRGNLRAIRLVTMENEPRVLELRGEDVYQVAHAYGTNGIITALEIPLARAYNWAEAIVTFPTFMQAARFGQSLGDADGIVKKLVTVFADPIPQYFTALRSVILEGSSAAFVMVSEESLEALQELVTELDGTIVQCKTAEEASKGTPIYEYTWNHTTLHARNVNPNLTYLQTLLLGDQELKRVEHFYQHFGNEVMMHLEFLRCNGRSTPAALQLVRYSTPDRLQEIITYHESHGAIIFNPHAYTIEDGGMKQVDLAQLKFKQQVDPYGLMNPGKMKGWNTEAEI
ncbi:MAG: FAD-binding oxidoreductase [Cyanobacteria bacterium]|nr:FAD-binding oxidoreductase [Cyanobacteriota bacterium]